MAQDISDMHETRARRLRTLDANADNEFVAMMEVAGFRAFVWRVLTLAHVFETSMGGDPHRTSFREGERNIGLMLMADIHRLCPDRYPLMALEARKREEERNG
jgi:hypothetical protein